MGMIKIGALYNQQQPDWFNEPQPFDGIFHQEEGEGSNKLWRDGGVFDIGGTSKSSTENINYVHGEVRGRLDQLPNHKKEGEGSLQKKDEAEHAIDVPEGWFVVQEEGEGSLQKKNNAEHAIGMPEGPDEKEQANDGPFILCQMLLANTVSQTGSNPPPWGTTPPSQSLLVFSGVAYAVGFLGTIAAVSLRYTKPRAARIFANVGAIGGAWGVIMSMTSYLPGEYQWLGYVAATFCAIVVALANY